MAMKCWHGWEICSGSLLKESLHCGERFSHEAGCKYSKIFCRDHWILYLLICPLYHNQKKAKWKKDVIFIHFLSITFPSKPPNLVYSNLITDTLGTDKNTIALHFIQKKPGYYRSMECSSHFMIHNSIPCHLLEKNKAPLMFFPFCLNSCHAKKQFVLCIYSQ